MYLTDAQLAQFRREGYVVKPDILAEADLQPLKAAITAIIDREARALQEAGQLEDICRNAPFERRLAQIYALNPLAGEVIVKAIKGNGGGGFNGPTILQCIRHPGLLACMGQLIGPDIIGSSVYRIRPKLPGWPRGEVPWHQDSGYTLAHCDRYLVVTCWIPMVDATLENGCLYVIPGVHQQGILPHYTGGHAGFLEVPTDELPAPKPIPVPVPAGGVLFLTNMTPHASFANSTNQVRWSMDLRYQGLEPPNNVDEDPATYIPEREPVTMACHPTEADFVIQDTADPTREIRNPAAFQALRERYERVRSYSPGRGWTPLKERKA